MSDLPHCIELYYLADRLIADLSKEQLAEATRLLALHVAQYAQRYGDLPSRNVLELLGVVELSEQQTDLLHDGLETLVGYLGTVRQLDDERAERLKPNPSRDRRH